MLSQPQLYSIGGIIVPPGGGTIILSGGIIVLPNSTIVLPLDTYNDITSSFSQIRQT